MHACTIGMRSKFIFFALLVVSGISPGYAREDSTAYDDEPPYRLFDGRLLFGTNFSQLNGDTYGGYHKVGLNMGGQVYVHFSRLFGVSLELLYSQKGVRGGTVKESYTLGTYFDKYYLNLNYAEAVLMAHFDTYIFDYEAGISYARLIRSDEWAEADVPVVIDPALAYFNSYDVNYAAGISGRINDHWHCNMRYQYSITPVRSWDRVLPRYSDGSGGQHNEAVSLRLVYVF